VPDKILSILLDVPKALTYFIKINNDYNYVGLTIGGFFSRGYIYTASTISFWYYET